MAGGADTPANGVLGPFDSAVMQAAKRAPWHLGHIAAAGGLRLFGKRLVNRTN
ncbi:hypothetical protein [Belnapia sp. F-4-1]|uniref:hypothetical protein n=1 Tax=Belnapia sp. F-4-1 TaxID=1545443 RepID=UPI00136493A6|nr:hypothetical protein [Belnapia sp. F-4-1]